MTRLARTDRGFATVAVLLALGLAIVVLVGLQASALRQAAAGREAAARVRAHWAARAGLEATISALAYETERGATEDAFEVYDAMDRLASGALAGAEFDVRHTYAGRENPGVFDAHARINVNRMGFDDLMELEGMSEDQAAAILDWVDADDSTRELGAEAGYYRSLDPPYEPRNAPLKTLAELELVAGVRAEDVRGEDWNLNARLDPNEDDGDATWPPDDGDGRLDAGWSAWITTESVEAGGVGVSGEERLYLLESTDRQLTSVVEDLSMPQARAVLDYVRRDGARIEDLISTPLSVIAPTVANLGAPPESIQDLTGDQILALLEETTLFGPDDGPIPGRLNLNTADREALDYLPAIPTALADQIMFARDTRPGGFSSILDLIEVTSPQGVTQLSTLVTVRSNAFVVSSVGRDLNSGVEVGIVATIERTSWPVIISEMSVR